MFSNTALWVGLGLLLLTIVVVLYNTPRAKASRKRRAEEYLRQEEERKEKEKAEAARKAKQMENFRKQRLVVYIREKDGRKSSLEAVLIRMLLEKGITVELLPENSGRAIAGGDTASLKSGLLALTGTSWVRTVNHEGHYVRSSYKSDGYYQPAYTEKFTHCDYRLLATEGDAGKILGAGCDHRSSSCESSLANGIIEDLARTIPVTPEAN
jgi:hypothetical protein